MSETGLKSPQRARPLRVKPQFKLLDDTLGATRLCSATPAHEPDLRAARAIGYAPNYSPLTGRQLTVAQMVALGLADKEIAVFLRVSQGTVKGNISLILHKLNLHRRTQICRYIHEMDLLPRD
ncbi:response regulator transcription factor [Acidocella aquatica]|nr:LuxR C-terminal-related transcriptional regulator [Acidocella aquatica]